MLNRPFYKGVSHLYLYRDLKTSTVAITGPTDNNRIEAFLYFKKINGVPVL